MDLCLIFLIIFAIILIVVAYIQIVYDNKIEHFDGNHEDDVEDNKLLVKKTLKYNKVFENKYYTSWLPEPIDDYFPTGTTLTQNKKKPKTIAILVKNEHGKNSKDKPINYEINAITNNNNAIWSPIPNEGYISLGNIYSKDYPSKFLIRCVPEKYCQISNLKAKLITNYPTKDDSGYELWSINKSNNFVCNNLNNSKTNFESKIPKILNPNKLTVDKKIYIRNTRAYKKLCSFTDSNTNKKLYIWRPKAPKNFCSLGDICLTKNINPNKSLDTIVVHKSFCKIANSYGSKYKNRIKLGENKYAYFWRPIAPENYHFFGDVVTLEEKEPESDDITYCISLDYIDEVDKNTHTMIWNNISSNNSMSLWSDTNNFMTLNNNYSIPANNGYVLNKNFTKSDYDLLDKRRIIEFNYIENKKGLRNIEDKDLIDNSVKTLSSKLDINSNRIVSGLLNRSNNTIEFTFEPRKYNGTELKTASILKQLNKIFQNDTIKIYNQEKNYYYIELNGFILKNFDINKIELDNSEFINMYENKH